MSINVYLRGDKEVRSLEGFSERLVSGERGSFWHERRLPGVRLEFDKGRWSVSLSKVSDRIPEAIKDLVEEISLWESIPVNPSRERGSYTHQSAKGELELSSDKKAFYIEIRGEKMEHVSELLKQIKAGAIRPDVSYDGPQDGLSRKELVVELERLRRENENLQSTNKEYLNRLAADKTQGVLNYIFELEGPELWPLCWKERVASKLRGILGVEKTIN